MMTADTEPVSVESRVPWFEEHSPAFRPLWVCEEAGRVRAWLSFSSFYGRPAYARTAEIGLYVHESFRRLGLRKHLLKNAFDHAPLIRVDTLLGLIVGHNAPSLAQFERFGFSRWGKLPKVASLAEVERDRVIVGHRA